MVYDSADDPPLDAPALRRIYGGSLPPQIVQDVNARERGDEQRRSPRNVA